MPYLFRCVFLFLLPCILAINGGILLNIILDEGESIDTPLSQVIEFVTAVKSNANSNYEKLHMEVYVPSKFHQHVAQHKSIVDLKLKVTPFTTSSLPDYNIDRFQPQQEHVSQLLESLSNTLHSMKSMPNSVLLSLAFSTSTTPIATSTFHHLFDSVSPTTSHIKLLEKTSSFTSISDWRDLMLLALLPSHAGVIDWFNTLHDVYLHHADRTVYNLFEPRAAILEANIQHNKRLTISHFRPTDLCVIPIDSSKARHHCSESVPLEVDCNSDDLYQSHVCSTIHHPNNWKAHLQSQTTGFSFPDRYRIDMGNLKESLPKGGERGTQRFKYAADENTPADFCWNTGSYTYEKPTESRIYQSFENSKPYTPPAAPMKSHTKITMITASNSKIEEINVQLFQSIGKMYYCKRHGYEFAYKLSNQYVGYFGPKFLENAVLGKNEYGQGVMSKVVMIFAQMYESPESEWIMWTDGDTWINPGWLHLPLDVYLDDVPADKLVVLGNYRSAFTNVFFIRNSVAGRQLARDWLALAGSGYIQCHGFDQGALESLILARMSKLTSPTPYNHTCLSYEWISNPESHFPVKTIDKLKQTPQKWQWGCGEPGDWSCDFEYEWSLWRVGFRSRSANFFNGRISSFSKGCANEHIPDFFVTFETEHRPRLHAAFCGKLDEVEASEYRYDGPLGGGNDWVRRNAVNGWMFNHKFDFPFYDSYIKPESCKKVDNVLEPCDAKSMEILIRYLKDSSETNKRVMIEKGKSLISLIDGIGYDVDGQTFCAVNNELLAYQKEHTHMRDYKRIIELAKSISDTEWEKKWHDYKIQKGWLNWLARHDGSFFEAENFCDKCRKVKNEEYIGDPTGSSVVVDCT